MNATHLELFCYMILEREAIRIQKEAGAERPWTEDPVLHTFRFCNVRREDDRTTVEIRAVADKVALDHLPAFYTLARMLNRAAPLELASYYMDHPAKVYETLDMYRTAGNSLFHAAYVVSTCGRKMDKLHYVMQVYEEVLGSEIPDTTLEAAYEALIKVDGLGSFLAGQVVADLKNDRYLLNAPDWSTWSSMGPGSKKGLNLLFNGGTTHGNYQQRMDELERNLPANILALNLHRQDLQNCLCEFSKYHNYLAVGLGRRRYYVEH